MIEENKQTYLKLLQSCNRDVSRLCAWLESTDFFIAPASTKYHSSYKGGLCQHCLNVYRLMSHLSKMFNLDITEEQIIIVSLLHDLGKVNYYTPSIRNEKLYTPDGSKYDNLGNYEWVSVQSYKIKDAKLRFVGADHGTNAVLLAEQYVTLTLPEKIAIINHHANQDIMSPPVRDLSDIYNQYPLAFLLHIADMCSTFILEANNE